MTQFEGITMDFCSKFFLAITVTALAVVLLLNTAESKYRAYDINNQESLEYVVVDN